MTKVYVETSESTGGVLNISTQPMGSIYQEVILKDPAINFDKLSGYEVTFTNGEYCLVFNQEKYDACIAEQKKEEALKEGEELMKILTAQTILDNATDTEAYIMRYKYEEWQPKTKYEVNDRRRYGDNLYKCKQAHTSEEGPDRTPDKLPALWDIVNSDSSKGTKKNPIIIPEPFSSMIYTYGLYYLENGILYQCERGGVSDPESMYGQEISLTYKPSQLVGHYFKVVE